MKNTFDSICSKQAKNILLTLIFLVLHVFASAQDSSSGFRITGTVYDDNGTPLPGASIVVKGTTNGVTTDFDGNFSIEVSPDNGALVVSYIGFLDYGFSPLKEDYYQITLIPNETVLDEVVLIGYGSSKQKDLTGSVSSLKLDDVQSQPSSNIGDAIQGRAAGVRVITSGRPGNNPTFRIRGTGTINNNDPLIIVDEVPLNGGLNQVNMMDVESIQVLKDASSTAIYGARGANGVVIITTKRGKKGVGNLNINFFTGVQNATDVITVLNAGQFAQFSNEMLLNGGQIANPDFLDPGSLGKGTDWIDAFFTTGRQNNVTLSYSNGSEKSNLYTSLNVFDQDGIIINSDYTRYIFQFNSDTDITDKLRFGNSIKLNYDLKKSGENNIDNALLALPTQAIFREDGDYSGPIGQPIYSGDVENPIGKSNIVENSTDGYNLQGSVFGEIDLFKNLKFKTLFGVETNLFYERTWAASYEWDTDVSPNAFLREASNRSITTLFDNTLTYNKEFDSGTSFTAVIGTSAQENTFKFQGGSIQNFSSESTQQLDNGVDQATINGNASEWAIFSYFARATFDFKDKYYLTGTIRRDGSSRFGEGNKYGTFPSASVAWRVTEDFFKESESINDLKLRVGYGITGNQEIGNYSFASAFNNTFVTNFNNNLVTAAVLLQLPNTNVKWESQKQANIGIDATLFNNRVDLTVDAYVKNTEDMLVPQSVPVTSGFSDQAVPFINAGDLRNKGIETLITTYNINNDKFRWSTDFVFAYNDNEVLDINSDTPLTTGSVGLNFNLARIQPGYPINVFYGYVQDGIFQTQAEVDNWAVQVPGTNPATSTSPGDIRFKDLNSDGIINDDDRTFIGNPNPEFTYSINNSFTIGNFELGVFLQGVHGNDIFNANRLFMENMSVTTNQSTGVLNRWAGPGTSNTTPRAVFGDPNNNTRPSTRFIEDGSYIRLKNVNLAYNIPLDNKNYFSKVQVYFSGQNLFTLSDYSGFDPEVVANGIDDRIYPVARTFILGVNLGL